MHAGAALDEQIRQASGPTGIACDSSSRRADPALHAGSARVQELRQRDRGDRLRGEFPTGRGTGEVLRAGHETGEAGLPVGARNSECSLAPLPPRIIEKCLASYRIRNETVIDKYCNHTPLYRQSMILERDIGLEISRATLDGWVLKVGELLIPTVAAMRRELISGSYIQADETPVDVQVREGRGKNHQAYLWQYSRPGGNVVFDFRLGRGRDGPKRFLRQFEGILQTDGYTGYDQIGGTKMVHAACWAHARRQFFEAVQLNPRDPVATPIVARMDDLFAIDAEARRRGIGLAGADALRQGRAKPLLDDIRTKIEAAQSVALPSSALSKACQYALTLWRKLTRFLEYPELELSSNLAENSMRPVALGREELGYTSAVHRRDRRWQRFCRSWKAAAGFRKFRCATTFPRFSPGLPISRSNASQSLLSLRGLPATRPLYLRPAVSNSQDKLCFSPPWWA